MKEWFNFIAIADKPQRTLGFIVRLLGIDFSVMLLGWISDWKLIDLRIPVNYGVFCQSLFLMLAVGRLPTSTYDKSSND